MKYKLLLKLGSLLTILFIMLTPIKPVHAQMNVVVVTTTIQAAVDAANPGDTVHIPPGTYHRRKPGCNSGWNGRVWHFGDYSQVRDSSREN